MAGAIAQQSHAFQILLCLAFFIGFAIKVPMFPFHTWLPDAHVEAPTAGSVVLAGVLLKMGTYGFVRFLLPIVPRATMELMPWFMGLALIGVIYGALVAMIQKDMKKLVAYSSVSHLGLCMIGLFAMNPNGITGGMFQMLNHGISTSTLFLLVGIVYERRHTRMIAEYGGLSKTMPVYATVFMIMTLSSIGLPGLNGFIGEFAILQGAFQAAPWLAVLATTGIILGAAYMLWLLQRAMFGPVREVNTKMKDSERPRGGLLHAPGGRRPSGSGVSQAVHGCACQAGARSWSSGQPRLLQGQVPRPRPAGRRQGGHGRHARPGRGWTPRGEVSDVLRRWLWETLLRDTPLVFPQLVLVLTATVMLWPGDLFVPRGEKRRAPASRWPPWWSRGCSCSAPHGLGFNDMFEVDGMSKGFQYLVLAAGIITVLLASCSWTPWCERTGGVLRPAAVLHRRDDGPGGRHRPGLHLLLPGADGPVRLHPGGLPAHP